MFFFRSWYSNILLFFMTCTKIWKNFIHWFVRQKSGIFQMKSKKYLVLATLLPNTTVVEENLCGAKQVHLAFQLAPPPAALRGQKGKSHEACQPECQLWLIVWRWDIRTAGEKGGARQERCKEQEKIGRKLLRI